jgi:hypothetical protein
MHSCQLVGGTEHKKQGPMLVMASVNGFRIRCRVRGDALTGDCIAKAVKISTKMHTDVKAEATVAMQRSVIV